MSTKLYCSLCWKPCSGYKLLHNEIGESNEIYEKTMKYFDPSILQDDGNTKLSKDNKVLCLICWLHINGFHQFQQSVRKFRKLPKESAVKQLEVNLEVQQPIIGSENDNNLNSTEEKFDNIEELLVKRNLEDDIKTNIENENDEDKANEKPEVQETANEPPWKKRKLSRRERRERRKEQERQIVLQEPDDLDKFIAKWKPVLECYVCSKPFFFCNLLKTHITTKHSRTRFLVKCCGNSFYYSREKLANHLRLHAYPELFKCDICGLHCNNLNYHKLKHDEVTTTD